MVLLLRIFALVTIIISTTTTTSVVDAISKNSSPHIPPATSLQSENNISSAANTIKKRDNTTSNDDNIIIEDKIKGELQSQESKSKSKIIKSRPKISKSTYNRRTSSIIRSSSSTTKTTTTTSTLLNVGVSSSQSSSTSLRRIKKEYKDAVNMGIAYDWVNQRRIVSKKNRKTKEEESSSDVSTSPTSTTTTYNNNKNTIAPDPVIDTTTEDDQKILCLGPLTSNLRHWHFSFRGAGGKGGIYNNGIYHGLIKLSKDYPMSPPDIQVWTPSGRFKPGMDICLSASAYHPEAWTPRWSIFGMVNALRLHMLSSPNEIGAMTSTTAETLEFARLSLTWKKTWVDGTGSKKKYITADHQLLLSQGVLSLESDNEDDVENIAIEQKDNTPLPTEDNLKGLVMEKEGDDMFSIDDVDSLDNNENNNSIRTKKLFTTLSSLFQIACLFLVTRILLSLFS